MKIRSFGKRIVSYILKKAIVFWGRLYNDPHKLCDDICGVLEENSDMYYRYHLYPKRCNQIDKCLIETNAVKGEFAIIIQGSIDEKFDFTYETVRFYKRIFPMALIIISTWDNTNQREIEKLKSEGCEVILNKVFDNSGFCNLNYQICTSLAGLKRAKELGAKYSLKNRSDMRICKDFSYEYLKFLLGILPVSSNILPLRERIVTVSGFRGQMFYPNFLQDFIYFGNTDDLIDFFDIPYDDRNISSLYYWTEPNKIKNGKEYCSIVPPEIYLTSKYLDKYGVSIKSVKDYWDFVKNFAVIINFSDLNLIWDKYQMYSEDTYDIGSVNARLQNDYFKNFGTHEFIGIYSGAIPYNEKYEHFKEKVYL